MKLRTLLPLLSLLWAINAAAFTHGQLSETITWELTDSVLRITGSGPMPSFDTSSTVSIPWAAGQLPSCISRIEIGEGITEVGAFTFSSVRLPKAVKAVKDSEEEYRQTIPYCNLRSVSLPSTLKKIHRNAFTRLPITAIRLPEGLEEIGYGAFANTDLRGVKLPSTIKRLGNEAFAGCPSLQGVDMNSLHIGLPGGFLYDCEHLRMILHTQNLRGIKPSTFNATVFQQFPEEDLMEMFRSDGVENYLKTHLPDRKTYAGTDEQYQALRDGLIDEFYVKEAKNETFMFNVDTIVMDPYDSENGSTILHTTNSGDLLLQCTPEQYAQLRDDWENLRHKIRPTYFPSAGRVTLQFATVQIPPAKLIAAPI